MNTLEQNPRLTRKENAAIALQTYKEYKHRLMDLAFEGDTGSVEFKMLNLDIECLLALYPEIKQNYGH